MWMGGISTIYGTAANGKARVSGEVRACLWSIRSIPRRMARMSAGSWFPAAAKRLYSGAAARKQGNIAITINRRDTIA